jgi:A/G-specific adenine glycosylase
MSSTQPLLEPRSNLRMHRDVLAWFEENKRDLPWRKSTPWGVMVSEFMLQQTPVNRVLPIWIEWMERWPTPKDLASTKKSDLLKAWGRLGYPRRAIRLHEAATIIAKEFNNQVPAKLEDLRKLPGVGEYTAAAIMAFAHKKSSLVLDINIRRLFSRVLDGEELPALHITNHERESRTALIPTNAHTWAAATMELGALICTATKPKCETCPLSNSCLWRAKGYPQSQNVKKKTQKWHGTDRQCRGAIIEYLRNHPKATESSLSKIWDDSSQLEKCLASLTKDGLITKNKKSYALSD